MKRPSVVDRVLVEIGPVVMTELEYRELVEYLASDEPLAAEMMQTATGNVVVDVEAARARRLSERGGVILPAGCEIEIVPPRFVE